MRTLGKVSLLALLIVSIMSAQQIATVTSSAPFTLRGASVNPGQGVPSFPIMANDVVVAGSALTIVTFPDGSTVTLDPGSQGRIETVNGRSFFRLLAGRAEYRLQSLTALGLAEASNTVTPTQTAGVLVINNQRSGGGFWTPTTTTIAVVGGAGAAAALGFGLAAADDGGEPVSAR